MKKRFEVRRATERPVEIISSQWDIPVEFTTCDMSPRGAFIQSDIMLDMGETIVCSFKLDENTCFDFFAEVVRVNLLRREVDSGKPGFGVRFLDARPKERLKIREVLKGTPPPIPTMRKVPPNGKRVKHPAKAGIKMSPIIVV